MDRNAKSRENKGLFQWEKRATAWSIYWLLTDYCTERLKCNLFMLSHTLSILWSLCWTVVYSCENSWQEAAETCILGEPACELEWMVLLSRLRFPEDSLWIQQDFFVFVFCFLMCCTLMGRFHTNLLGFFFFFSFARMWRRNMQIHLVKVFCEETRRCSPRLHCDPTLVCAHLAKTILFFFLLKFVPGC